MTSAEYKKYLNTNHWKDVKIRYRASKSIQVCYICGTDEKINLHHKSYKRIGAEKLNDLLPLCSKCHMLVHTKLKLEHNNSKLNLWTMAHRIKRVSKGKYFV